MTRISFDPQIPLALWVPLALAAAGLLVGYALASRGRLSGLRRWAVLALMAVGLALPLGVLLGPTWLQAVPPPPGKPLLTVLVDSSASMATHDAAEGRSRYDEACRMAQAAAEKLGDRYEVRLRKFAAESSPVGVESLTASQPGGGATDLGEALDRALDDERPQGQAVVLLSDGIHNSGDRGRLQAAAARARALAVPVFTRALGTATEVRDLEVELKRPQEVAFVHQQVPVAVSLRQRGSLAASANVVLLADGKELQRRTVKLKPSATVDEVFRVTRPEAGLFHYEVRADALPGEVTPLNNTASLALRVVNEPVRILLLEGKPYWDTKFLIRSLSTDESIELTCVVQMAAGRLFERRVTRPGGKKVPANPQAGPGAVDQWSIEKDAGRWLADPAALASYQIVVLGRGAEVFLSDEALARLRKWIDEQDGSLVCFRGPPSSQINQRLDELMPVRWTPGPESRFRARWTDEGQDLRWLPAGEGDPLSAMPSLATARQIETKPTGVTVLATSAAGGKSVPVVACRYVGNTGGGRVVVIEGAGMWRWAFLSPQHKDRDEVYGSLWRSLVRWLVTDVGLAPSQRFALKPDKGVFHTDEPVTATLLLRESKWTGGTPQIELSGPGLAEPRQVPCKPWSNVPGQYHAEFGRLAEGRWRLGVVGAAADETSAVATLDVRGNLKEQLDVAARSDQMARIAQASGGAALDGPDLDELVRQFDELRQRNRPERVVRNPAWDRWWVLVGVLGLWGMTWAIRRRSGLT